MLTESRKLFGSKGLAALAALALIAVPGWGQNSERRPMTEDWSDKQVIFSTPKDVPTQLNDQADPRYKRQRDRHDAKGKGFDNYDMRVPLSLLNGRRDRDDDDDDGDRGNDNDDNNGGSGSVAISSALTTSSSSKAKPGKGGGTPVKPKGDWSVSLGPNSASLVGSGQFPAKFSFDINAAPSCEDDYVVFAVNRTGAGPTQASRVGTFSAAAGTGTVTVNGTVLTASAGTAASRTGTFTANSLVGGETITVNGTVLTASAPVKEVDRIAFGATPANNSSVTIAGIAYIFKTADWISGSMTSTQCFIRTSVTTSNMVSRLASAITTGSANTGASVSTWQCGTSANQPAGGVVVTGSTSPNVDVTAKIAGSTGFTLTTSGTTNLTTSVTTAASDGSSTFPAFQFWSGAAAVNTTTLAGNVQTAIDSITGVTGSNSTNVVTVTADVPGTDGNSIALATDIPSGFTWAGGTLTGGAAGTNTGTSFDTSNSTTNAATNLAAAINRSISAAVLTATSSTNTVTVTATVGGASGNSITTTEAMASFSWAGTTLTGGGDGQPSIVAFNNLYAGPANQAAVTGTFTGVAAAGNTVTVTNGGNALVLTAATAAAPATASGTFSANPTATITINGLVLTETGTASCTSTTAATYNASNTASTNPSRIVAAVALCSGLNFTVADGGSGVLNVTSTATGTGATLTFSVSGAGFVWNNTSPRSGSGTSPGCTSSTAGAFSIGASATAQATNLATAIAACGTSFPATGVTATNPSAGVVRVAALTAGAAGNSITVAESTNNFTWAASALFGGVDDGICGTGDATVKWSYDTHTGSGGPVPTSPVLSWGGDKVAYVESRASGGSVLHVLRAKPDANTTSPTVTADGTIPTPATVTPSVDGSAWTTCLAGSTACLYDVVLTGSSSNTTSSPYYDYATDALYVGDNTGLLFKVTDVFNGTPALAGGSWPIQNRNSGSDRTSPLTGPVYDYGSNNIYFGDTAGGINYVRESTSSIGTCESGSVPCAGAATAGLFSAITDPPVVDSSTGYITYFGKLNAANGARVVQRTQTLAAAASITLGGATASGTTAPIRVGTYSEEYFAGADPSAGNLYVCGYGATAVPTLYRLAFTSAGQLTGTSGTGLALGTGTTATAGCSPLTSILNTTQSKQWLFVGVGANCAFSGSATGCVESFDITGSVLPSTAYNTADSPGGTSGIVVDNVSASGHASSIYYGTGGVAACNSGGSAGGCAVHRTQDNLN